MRSETLPVAIIVVVVASSLAATCSPKPPQGVFEKPARKSVNVTLEPARLAPEISDATGDMAASIPGAKGMKAKRTPTMDVFVRHPDRFRTDVKGDGTGILFVAVNAP